MHPVRLRETALNNLSPEAARARPSQLHYRKKPPFLRAAFVLVRLESAAACYCVQTKAAGNTAVFRPRRCGGRLPDSPWSLAASAQALVSGVRGAVG